MKWMFCGKLTQENELPLDWREASEIHTVSSKADTQKCHLSARSAGSENYKRGHQTHEMPPSKMWPISLHPGSPGVDRAAAGRCVSFVDKRDENCLSTP